MPNREEILALLKKTDALLTGHYKLTSGLHSNGYIQCAQLLKFPWVAEQLCQDLANRISKEHKVDLVIGPALGGIIVAHETARALSTPAVFAERYEGALRLRRNFTIGEDQRVAVVEDVVTTGGSVKEVIRLIKDQGGRVEVVASLIDRSQGKVDFSVPYYSLIALDLASYQPDDCPLCKEGYSIDSPGSRLQQNKGE